MRTLIFILLAASPIITMVVLPMLINKTTEIHFDWTKKHLRELWWGLLVYCTIFGAVLSGEFKELVMAMKQGFGSSYPRFSYVAVGLIGAIVFIGYWWILGKAIPAKANVNGSAQATPLNGNGTVGEAAPPSSPVQHNKHNSHKQHAPARASPNGTNPTVTTEKQQVACPPSPNGGHGITIIGGDYSHNGGAGIRLDPNTPAYVCGVNAGDNREGGIVNSPPPEPKPKQP